MSLSYKHTYSALILAALTSAFACATGDADTSETLTEESQDDGINSSQGGGGTSLAELIGSHRSRAAEQIGVASEDLELIQFGWEGFARNGSRLNEPYVYGQVLLFRVDARYYTVTAAPDFYVLLWEELAPSQQEATTQQFDSFQSLDVNALPTLEDLVEAHEQTCETAWVDDPEGGRPFLALQSSDGPVGRSALIKNRNLSDTGQTLQFTLDSETGEMRDLICR